MKLKITAAFLLILGLASCRALKPWERVYLNDPAMQMGGGASKQFENHVHAIREGAIPTGGSGASGGCGCN